MRSACTADRDPKARNGARMQHLARALALAAVVVVDQAGCAAAPRSGPRDLGALERERAALEANAQRACEGIPPGDMAPGLSGLDVVRVAVLERPVRYRGNVVEGAAAVVRTAGRPFESMELLMRCRAARAAVVRDPVDSLAVPGASVRVYRDDGEAVIVQIRTRREDGAREIVRRLRSQVPGSEDEAARHGDASHVAETHDPAPHGRPPSRSPALAPPSAGPARPSWRR